MENIDFSKYFLTYSPYTEVKDKDNLIDFNRAYSSPAGPEVASDFELLDPIIYQTEYDTFGKLFGTTPKVLNKSTSSEVNIPSPTTPISTTPLTDNSSKTTKSSGPRLFTSESEIRNAEAMWKKAKPLYNIFVNAGIDLYVALALLGNIAFESSCDPNASNNVKGGHFGLTQNERSGRDWIIKNYGAFGRNNQMLFLIHGLKGQLSNIYNYKGWYNIFTDRFRKFNEDVKKYPRDLHKLVYSWAKNYEKSEVDGHYKRYAYAEYFSRKVGL